jgi:predicted dehydrogenase
VSIESISQLLEAAMTPSQSRRSFLKTTAASALAGVALPQVHAGEDSTIQLALIGSGSRGAGAAENALKTTGGPTRLVAMADVFPNRIKLAHTTLTQSLEKQIDVPEERRFIGFDGYRKAMDVLKKGDVVILTTPPAFRWPMFAYAIEKGLNVFMEKPISVDAPTTRRMLELNKKAEEKNLKVGVGLMCRHCVVRQELYDRIKQGAIGDILLLRAYRCKGREATCFTKPRPASEPSDLLYQIKNFHSFLWLSGGSFSDFLIHNIDECCWMKDAWPVAAKGYGGRHYRGDYIDQNFDVYDVEYTFADGAKLMLKGRTMPDCSQEFASLANGTKGSAVICMTNHSPAYPRIFRTQNINMRSDVDIVWKGPPPKEEPDPYQLEWDHLMAAIRDDKPFNEVERGAMASAVTAMGRYACHTGRDVTLEQYLKHDQEFAPEVDQLTLDGPSPLKADADGKYPLPEPGRKRTREY